MLIDTILSRKTSLVQAFCLDIYGQTREGPKPIFRFMEQPIVFLAFANDQDNHLALLNDERKVIQDHLLPLANQSFIQLFIEPTTTIDDLTKKITAFKDRVSIFHYGGHAESSKVILEDQEADADGIAQLLANQPNLKLVFLNGCSTKAQVDLLLKLGIPSVIATSVPVKDPAALSFADAFYGALTQDHSIEKAFDIAASNYQSKTGTRPEVYRGFEVTTPEEDTMPWGLYVHPDKAAVLDWKIPTRAASSFIIRNAGLSYEQQVSMNNKLIETIVNTIEPFSQDVQALRAEAKRRRRDPKLRDLRAAVIDAFPTPLGTHLRKLLLSNKINTERLQKIVNVYNIATQMLSYTMLAQLWDEKHQNETYLVPEEDRQLIKRFFELDQANLRTYDFVDIIRAVGDIFDQNGTIPFVDEFATLRKEFREDSTFKQAYQFLEEMKKELEGTIAADEIESFCVQAEDKLCEIFKHIGFSAKYKMVAIKHIELQKERHQPPSFQHNMVWLDRITASFGILDESITYEGFVENESVVLLKMEDNIHPYLNLSPFIIDENALTSQTNSKIYFFNYTNEDEFQYLLTDNLTDRLSVSSDSFEKIYRQMKTFYRLVIG